MKPSVAGGPPKFALRLLRWFCDPGLIEDLEGDLTELFHGRTQKSIASARLLFWRDVLMLFRPGIVKNFHIVLGQNSNVMLRNYLKVAVRNFIRNRTYVFINVTGLSVAIAIGIVVYLNYQHTMEANREHQDYQRIFKVNGSWVFNGDPQGVGTTPLPLAAFVRENMATVKNAVRYHRREEVIKRGTNVFREDIAYIDPAFLRVFDFPLLEGSPEVINDPGQIIISHEMATRFFNDGPALGQEIRVIVQDKEFLYTVGGVLMERPTNSSFHLDAALLPLENYFDHYPEIERSDWGESVNGTFVKLYHAHDRELVEEQLENYVTLQNEANEQLPFERYYLNRVDHWAQEEYFLRNGYFRSGMGPAALWGLNSSAILILLLSCFNFTNTSISFSNKRLKEIGIRKVFGGVRLQLITQFLVENLLLIFVALGVGLILAELLIPAYNNLFWFIRLELDPVHNFNLLAFLLLLLVIVAAFSAIYPSVYVSSFRPVNIFQGKTRFGQGGKFLRILIATQFIITVYNIFSSIVFYQNGRYQNTFDLGYDVHQTIVVPVSGESDFSRLKHQLQQRPEVSSLAGSQTQLAFSTAFATLEVEENEMEVGWMKIGHDYLATMGIALEEGRVFEESLDSYLSKNVLLNEEMVSDLGWKANEKPVIGRQLYLDSAYYTVIGVVKNFHEKLIMRGGEIRPVILTLAAPEDFRFLTVRSDQNLSRVNDLIQSEWAGLFPDAPYDGYYQSRVIEVVQDTNHIIDRVNLVVVMVSILLSSIGLYSMVSLNIIKRIKEIGIRKVLGASVTSIILRLNRNFAGLLVIGVVGGSISGYFVMDWLLSIIYAYRLPLDLWPMLFSVGVLILTATATVGAKVYHAARINPVEHLRNE